MSCQNESNIAKRMEKRKYANRMETRKTFLPEERARQCIQHAAFGVLGEHNRGEFDVALQNHCETLAHSCRWLLLGEPHGASHIGGATCVVLGAGIQEEHLFSTQHTIRLVRWLVVNYGCVGSTCCDRFKAWAHILARK